MNCKYITKYEDVEVTDIVTHFDERFMKTKQNITTKKSRVFFHLKRNENLTLARKFRPVIGCHFEKIFKFSMKKPYDFDKKQLPPNCNVEDSTKVPESKNRKLVKLF